MKEWLAVFNKDEITIVLLFFDNKTRPGKQYKTLLQFCEKHKYIQALALIIDNSTLINVFKDSKY